MSHHILHKVAKTLKIVVLTLLVIAVAVPALLYVPFIQDMAKDIALRQVKKSTGMDISVGLVRLRFPLKVELDDVKVLEATGDTLATLASARVDVKLLPLIHGNIDAGGLDIAGVYYRLGTPDSATYLTADIDRLTLDDGDMNLRTQAIELDKAVLDGARINIVLKDTVVPEKADTAAASPMRIRANSIELRNVSCLLQMLPTIDSLDAQLPYALLTDGTVDMARHAIHAASLTADSIGVTYLLPPSDATNKDRAKVDSTATKASATEPWTVTADHVSLSGRTLTYAVRGATPASGFDMNYISVSGVKIDVDSLYNRGQAVRVPIRQLSATERCGLTLSAAGTFDMDSTRMSARDFGITAGSSKLTLDATMGMGDLVRDPNVPLRLKAAASIALADIETALPSMIKTLRGLPREAITLDADLDGTMGSLDVNRIAVDWPRYLRLNADGHVDNPTDFGRMNGRVNIDGRINNVNFLKPTLLGTAMSKQINVPPMTVKGAVDYRPNLIDGNIAVRTGDGRMALKGKWNGRAQGYDADLRVDRFPVKSIMPSLGLDVITATANVSGHGYDPMSHRTAIDADINLANLVYQGKTYSDIKLNARLADGKADGTIVSHNPGADLDADFKATLEKNSYTWDVSGDIRQLDLAALGFSKDPMDGSFKINTQGTYSVRPEAVDAQLQLTSLDWNMNGQSLQVPQLDATFTAADSLTTVNLSSGDLKADARVYAGLNPLMKMMTDLGPFLKQQIDNRNLDVLGLQDHIPALDARISAGRDNPAARFLAQQKITFNSFSLDAHNDSLLSLKTRVYGFAKDKFRLDSISLDANQHSKFLVYNVRVDNRPGTLDDFAHVDLKGYLANDKGSVLLNQHNIQGKQGFFLGFNAAFNDSTVNVKMVPNAPMIAYQKWRVNTDNRIAYRFTDRHVDANLELTNGKSLVHIYTDHGSGTPVDTTGHAAQEDLVINLSQIHLQDWLSISPFAPPIKGDLGADMRVRWQDGILVGRGTVGLTDLYYGRDRVGTFDLQFNAANTRSGAINADIALMVDSVKVITATGTLNDSTATNPFLLDFSMIRFPLKTVNPFLPKHVAQMRGMLNATMKISGTMARPVFNGYLDFDSTAVKVGFTGVSYPFSEEKIPVDSNVVHFDGFTIGGLNDHGLAVSGTVDVNELTNIAIDLGLKAENMQIVNSSRPRGADVYGKAFIDLDATARGNLGFLNVNADLKILPETNATYVLTPSTQAAITSRGTGDMVTFVQFNDTTFVSSDSVEQQQSMLLNLNAQLTVEEGSTLNVDISTDGKNKASIMGQGTLDYQLNPMNDGRLLGRFNINSGFVRYTPPLMSEINFKFNEGSYVNFTGDMLNPTLNIKAVDEKRANVTQEGQNSRLVNFLITLSLTQTLENMNLAFDLSTNDDITVENELSSMSAEQRANQAMNLLIYNVYTGPGTKGNANLSGNPLFSFLSSQLNTWAANNIKGVDISFGIDQYDKTTDGQSQTTTSYSYRVSKSLFNNRVKIVIGGNYSTDADADENFSQNLINDISFEYMLNRSGSMYVRLFRHVGYESILEGEVTQTGVGFVYRRKLESLRDIFGLGRRKKKAHAETAVNNESQPAQSTSADNNAKQEPEK